jgi:DUF4097 and DUF4098 domain-containing protein YvlB
MTPYDEGASFRVSRHPAWRPATWLTLAAAALTAGAALGADTRGVRQGFQFAAGAPLRLANLAGRVDLVAGQGNEVVVEAVIHGDAGSAEETRQLLQGMRWTQDHDGKGREEWTLSYPVDRFRSFTYPRPSSEPSSIFSELFDNGYTTAVYRGEKVRIYRGKRSSAPTLYADLRIAVPAGGDVAVRNVVGEMRAGTLEGAGLALATGSGDIQIASYAGRLRLDTSSGDIHVGTARGETAIDTGSGDVTIANLVGNGNVVTGSGDVRIDHVAAGKLVVNTGSGDVQVKDGSVGHLAADTGSGTVRVTRVEVDELIADTASGDVDLSGPLSRARRLTLKTGSGDVRIAAAPNASFDVTADQGSGDLEVHYSGVTLRRSGDKVTGARRGDGRTAIRVETGSGDCVIAPIGAGKS